MFRRRVDILERRIIVQVAMVKLIDNIVDNFFKRLEIDAHSQFVEFCGPDGDFHFPIVSVRFLAVSRIVSKMVSTWKMCFYKDIKHDLLRNMFVY